jgi:hypothetical protein
MEGDVVMSDGHGFRGYMVAGGMVVDLQIVAISDEQNSLLEEKVRLKNDNDQI